MHSFKNTLYMLWTSLLLLFFLPSLCVAESASPLYFNPDGGSRYHSDSLCPAVSARYLPLTPIPEADLTAEPYAQLTACPLCVRPDALYFNPDGGSCYHTDANCPSVSSDALPLTPIPDADLTAEPYAHLSPCPVCVTQASAE